VEGARRGSPALARVNELVRAAGGIVLRHGERGLEVLLVHRPAYEDWSLPKGKLEPGEPEREAALREVEEETGLRCLLGREVGTTEYFDSRRRPKQVRYWTMVAPDGDPAAANEVDDVWWASPAEAAERLDYAHDRALLDGLGDAAGRERELVYLVRHGKAGSREKWHDPDELRPLTAAGRRQAEGLAAQLATEPLAALVSSHYVRCVQTLEPLASALGLPVQEHDALAEGAPPGGALQLVRVVSALGPVVLSTHGDVHEFVVHSLAAEGVPLEGPMKFTKGSTWVLETLRGEIVAGRFVPPHA
jgi:8-oxo-dGTP diphosphatase